MSQPVVCGVYSLFAQHKLVYVGKSTNCYKRIADHRTNGRVFDYALVTAVPEADAAWVEAALIAAMEPVQNRAGKVREVAAPVALPTPLFARTLAPLLPKPDAEVLTRDPAAAIAKRYHLSSELRTVWGTEQLPTFYRDNRVGRGAIRLVTRKALIEWCEARTAAKAAA